jgi:hypothetical protein
MFYTINLHICINIEFAKESWVCSSLGPHHGWHFPREIQLVLLLGMLGIQPCARIPFRLI